MTHRTQSALAATARPRYHHGDLARVLVDEAVALARVGGPAGVGLREVARRAGVSATAAYRHFDSHEALLAAVGRRALEEMAMFMERELAELPRRRDPRRRALERWRATGRGYVHFAVAEPGLFRAAFASGSPAMTTGDPASEVARLAPAAGGPASDVARLASATGGPADPYGMLCAALHECVAAGALPPARRPGADELCWIAVHGLAALAVDGVLPSGGDHFDALLEATLDLVAGGLGATP